MAVAVLLTGVAAGVGGVTLTWLLHLVQHLGYGFGEPVFEAAVQQASPLRRVAALAGGGALAGLGWAVLRRSVGPQMSINRAVSGPDGRLEVGRTVVDAILQILAVGAGASLGREGAPRQVGAAAGEWLAGRTGLNAHQRRTVLAAGAGAGLAAVYDVPFGGTLFALEIVLVTFGLREAVAAAGASTVATVVASVALGRNPTYAVSDFGLTTSLLVASLLIGPLAGVVGVGFSRLTARARRRAATGWWTPVAVAVVFAGLGLLAWPLPELLGNGQGAAQLTFVGGLGPLTLLLLVLLKPLVTAACLRSGAVGGLLTPSLATGAALGALVGAGWDRLWPGSAPGAFALVGAAALLAATQKAPLTATTLVLEFTRSGLGLLAPILLAVCGALVVVAVLGGSPGPRRGRRWRGSTAAERAAPAMAGPVGPPADRPG